VITTDLNRAEFTGDDSETEFVFRQTSSGTNIPVVDKSHIKVYLTTTGTFTANDSTDVFTDSAHGHVDTQVIRVSATTSLPAGLLDNTDYYIRDDETNTFKLALISGGTAINITSAGSGTLTWTKTLLKTITTDYTVGIASKVATITFVTAPPTGAQILFIREVPFEQNTDLANNSQLDAESLESQLDNIVNQAQQINDKTARDLKLSDTLIATDATETAATLNVTSANRVNKSLKFDGAGNLSVSTINVDEAEDYILEAKSWAIEDGIVQTYDGTVGANVSPTEYSSKEYAQGDAPGGSSKEWAQTVDIAIDTTFSAKEYAQGDGNSDALTTGGSAKGWAQDTAKVNGATANDRSAKAWAQGASMTGATLGGSSKDWAQKTDGVVNTTFSAKEYAQGTQDSTGGSAKNWASQTGAGVTGGGAGEYSSKEWAVGEVGRGVALEGSAKDWATRTGATVDNASYSAKEYSQSTSAGTDTYGGSAKGWASTAYDTAVPGAGSGDRSALHYSTDASNSAIAAKASAAAVANSFDLFDDTYLGAMKDPFIFTASSSSGLLLTHAGHGLLDGNIVQVASAGTLPTGLSASTNYYVVNKTTNNFKLALASSGTPIVWSDAGSGVHTWVYGSPTTNGTWTKDSATITVVSNVGIRVGQKVSGTGIPAPTDTPANPIPNVLSIDGTAVVISQNMPAAGSAVATTFSSLGINGPYNTSTDGPSTNNDGEALASGNLFFNSTDNEMRIYDGANWIAASSAGSTSLLIYKYIATGSQTIFTGSDANGATLSYTANNINVFLNGVRLDASDYTATNGTSVVLDVGATVSDELVVTAYKSFTTADMVSASAGGTFNNNVSFGDNNITNVGSIALDSIVADGSNITISTDTTLAAGVDIETSTTGKIKQKGSFMQSSTHQAWVMGG